jgi:predicted tellurium resistance membrane protein TerC
MGAAALGGMVISVLVVFIFFLIGIAIMRWAFRINDIVKRLDTIVERLGQNKAG